MDSIRQISPELAKIAKDELNEDPAKIPEYINTLREWILTQPHLNCAMDSQFLLAFLRKAKFSLERAKTKIDLFYTVRTALPEFFTQRNIYDPEIETMLRLGVNIKLPKPLYEGGPRIILGRPGCFDPNKYDIKEIFKALTLLIDIDIRKDDNINISGVVALVDCLNMKPAHFLQLEPLFLQKMAKYFQECLGLRIKGIHVINLPKGIETFINFLKSFLTEKNRSRFFIYGSNFEGVYEHIPKHLLPKEYGGETSTIPEIMEDLIKTIKENEDILKNDEQHGVDETKRFKSENCNTNLFGTDGSFRKLDFD